MRKPFSNTIRSMMLLLLSIVTVGANAVCPNAFIIPGDSSGMTYLYMDEDLSFQVNEYNDDKGVEREMVIECPEIEGVYDSESQSEIAALNEEVSTEDLDSSSSYKRESEKTKPLVTVSKSLNEKFSFKGLILPGSLIAAGVIAMEAGLFKGEANCEVKENDGLDFEDIAQYVPAAAYQGLGLIPGIEHRHSFVERTMAAVTAYGMMFLITRPVKHWVHEWRPDHTSHDAFPSGHAATSFTGAELMRLEYGTGIGLGAYALATTVSVLRICHNRHWFNDVVAGAGVGILCARASYWLLPFERKLFGIKDPNVSVAAFPICNPQSHEFALGCCINF